MRDWIVRSTEKDVDGAGDEKRPNGNGHISDIEGAAKKKSSKGKSVAVIEEPAQEEEEEDTSMAVVPLGLEDQDYDDYGDEL
jgi:hypothetical protein